ncbi:hypothetical protein VQ056_31690 [Paenibacillus sp. JTLBN-2024]
MKKKKWWIAIIAVAVLYIVFSRPLRPNSPSASICCYRFIP